MSEFAQHASILILPPQTQERAKKEDKRCRERQDLHASKAEKTFVNAGKLNYAIQELPKAQELQLENEKLKTKNQKLQQKSRKLERENEHLLNLVHDMQQIFQLRFRT